MALTTSQSILEDTNYFINIAKEETDLEIRASASTGTVPLSAAFEIILVKN